MPSPRLSSTSSDPIFPDIPPLSLHPSIHTLYFDSIPPHPFSPPLPPLFLNIHCPYIASANPIWFSYQISYDPFFMPIFYGNGPRLSLTSIVFGADNHASLHINGQIITNLSYGGKYMRVLTYLNPGDVVLVRGTANLTASVLRNGVVVETGPGGWQTIKIYVLSNGVAKVVREVELASDEQWTPWTRRIYQDNNGNIAHVWATYVVGEADPAPLHIPTKGPSDF